MDRIQGKKEGIEKNEKEKKNIPAIDKVFEIGRPFEFRFLPVRRLILQLGKRLPDNILDDIDQTGPGLHLGPVGREGKAVLGNFEEGDAEGPDVRGDGVGLAGDALGRHVVGCADEGIGIATGAELAADTEVTQLHLSIATEEDIGGLDICVGRVRSGQLIGE